MELLLEIIEQIYQELILIADGTEETVQKTCMKPLT